MFVNLQYRGKDATQAKIKRVMSPSILIVTTQLCATASDITSTRDAGRTDNVTQLLNTGAWIRGTYGSGAPGSS